MSVKFDYRRSVTHCCGHSQTHTLHARCRQEADSWAFNLRKIDCDECKEKANRNAAEAKTAKLPALMGTPDQVTWAIAIRQRIFNMLSRTDRYHHVIACCQFEIQAKWWIENRNATLSIIVAHLTNSGRRAA